MAQEAHSLFWQISGNGLTNASYLYGTMHINDQRVFDFKPDVLRHFDAANALVLELNMDSINPLTVMNLMVMDSSITLSELLPEEDFSYVVNFIEDSLSLPIEFVEQLQPMFISSFVSERSNKSDVKDALDVFFFKRGKLQDKNIVGLEKVQEQIDAFNSIPYEEQAKGLLELIKEEQSAQKANNSTEELIQHYLDGNLDSLIIIATDLQESKFTNQSFEQIFLIDRNKIMTNRIVPIIKDQSAFIAIGAAHLPGKEGVIQLLREKGYTVEPR